LIKGEFESGFKIAELVTEIVKYNSAGRVNGFHLMRRPQRAKQQIIIQKLIPVKL